MVMQDNPPLKMKTNTPKTKKNTITLRLRFFFLIVIKQNNLVHTLTEEYPILTGS